jgi:hypothetical protein
MPRYVVERIFAEGAGLPAASEGSEGCHPIVARNLDGGVTWLHSYVSVDARTAFCVYEARSPEAIRKAAALNKLPVDRITQVRVLDPYCNG